MKKIIGLAGCSQLSMYMAQTARNLGFTVIGLSSKKTDPAVPFCDQWIKGKTNQINDIQKLAQLVDSIIFEDKMHFSEKILLQKHISTLPSAIHLNILTDLWSLKELLFDFKIPQINFLKINNSDDLDVAFKFFNSKVVFRKRFSEKNKQDTFLISTAVKLRNFKNSHKGIETHFLAEPLVKFKSEHRLIIARNKNNHFSHYPLFTLIQKNNQYESVVMNEISGSEQKKILSLILKFEKLMTQTDYVGLMTISLFKVQNDFYVFDADARPTNTGVITMAGFNLNQFEVHLKALFGEELLPVNHNSKNIICRYLISGQKGIVELNKTLQKKNQTCQIFIYGKTGKRKNRKLGHAIYTS